MTVRRVAFPIVLGNRYEILVLTFYRQVQGHQQSFARYGNGSLPMAAFRSLWWRLDGRQLVAAGTFAKLIDCQQDLP